MKTKNKRFTAIVLGVVAILLIPFTAMQFTNEVQWMLVDFVVAGALLFSTGLLCELVLSKVTRIEYRIALCGVLLIMLVLIWAELAVGIFGTPLAGS